MVTKNEAPVPFRAIHPGEILREELKERGITQREFAKQIGVQPSHLNDFIQGRRNLNDTLALGMEQALGIPYDTWRNLHIGYMRDRKAIAKRESKTTLRLVTEERTMSFRGEEFPYIHSSYEDSVTGKRTTTPELKRMNMSQVYNLYRASHGLPLNGRKPSSTTR